MMRKLDAMDIALDNILNLNAVEDGSPPNYKDCSERSIHQLIITAIVRLSDKYLEYYQPNMAIQVLVVGNI